MNTAESIKFYIGSNNVIKTVDKAHVISIVSKYFNGFTITDSVGMWNGEIENSIVIEFVNKSDEHTIVIKKALQLVDRLKSELNQDSVLLTVSNIYSN